MCCLINGNNISGIMNLLRGKPRTSNLALFDNMMPMITFGIVLSDQLTCGIVGIADGFVAHRDGGDIAVVIVGIAVGSGVFRGDFLDGGNLVCIVVGESFRQDVRPAYGEALGCHPAQGVIGVLPPGAVGSDLGSPVEIVVAEVGVLPDTSCKLRLLGYLVFLGIGVLHPADFGF